MHTTEVKLYYYGWTRATVCYNMRFGRPKLLKVLVNGRNVTDELEYLSLSVAKAAMVVDSTKALKA